MSKGKVGIESFLPTLKSLDQSGAIYFLEGGQAVNLWTNYVFDRFGEESGLQPYLPFTSKDCDVYVSMEAFRFFENANGTLHKSQSPADGQLGIYVLSEDDSLHVDLMTSVYGIPMEQIPRAIKRAQIVQGLYVLDPIYLFKAKCHNLADLPQAGRQDGKHVGMMSCIVPAYFSLLADELSSGTLTERQVIRELKFLIEICTKDRVVKRILQQEGISLSQLIPKDHLLSTTQPSLERFLSSQSSLEG